MKTFLVVTAALAVGVLIVVALGWLWLRRKLRGLGQALGQLAAGLSGVPPFRITLVPESEPEWSEPGGMLAGTGGFEGAGYQRVGDFDVVEMDGVRLRAFCHPAQHVFGVLYDHPQAGVFADVVALCTDRTVVTVSNAPETGLDRPGHSHHVRLDVRIDEPSGAQTLHDRVVRECADREVIATRPDHFVRAFTGAYALEQDWRIARGGVTAAEVRRVAEVGGQDPPDDCAVELVQSVWRTAIAGFVEHEVLKAYLADDPMPAADWEEQRERIRVVHDHGEADDLVEELAWSVIAGRYDPDDDALQDRLYEEARERLRSLFAGSLCAGFAEAQALLPEKLRFRKLGSVTRPWVGDVYLEPDEIADT